MQLKNTERSHGYANVPQCHIAYIDSKQFTSALSLSEQKTGLFH